MEYGIVNSPPWYYQTNVKISKRLGRRKKDARSCHDLMQDVCGSLHSGVKDPATNEKHMKGFGEWKR